MKKVFYIGVVGIVLYEIMKVYFIMPMPGSQRMNSLDLAYFLHGYRWVFRAVLGVIIVAGAFRAFSIKHKWIPALSLAAALYVIYIFNFEMLADKMFQQPSKVGFNNKTENVLNDSSIIVGVSYNGQAKAYPIRYIQYHHQVQDSVGGRPMIITYCNVCRTGRVFEPTVNGKHEKFRLVGMDHFNAMFEDETTKSWWRQATGEAVVGTLKGQVLPEVESNQTTLKQWFELYPDALVMQPDEEFRESYDSTGRFERGRSKGKLTRTDSLSWNDKSWVVGIQLNAEAKAYDWLQLKKDRIINDKIGGKPVVIVIASDDQSFAAFERPDDDMQFTIANDTLRANDRLYNLAGRDLSSLSARLPVVKAYQEFWHSWQTFHPNTTKYE